jgi:hypothetical protein
MPSKRLAGRDISGQGPERSACPARCQRGETYQARSQREGRHARQEVREETLIRPGVRERAGMPGKR